MGDDEIDLTVLKIGILGDSTVGKTCLCHSYMNIEFANEQLSTIGADKSEKKITLKDGKEIKLIIWDTAGQERFRAAGLKYAKNAQGIVIVFDVTNKNSFKNIEQWIELINDNFKNPSIVLFGNKVDIEKKNWQVSYEEAKEFADKMKFPYFETSAYTKQGMDDGFSCIANEIYDKLKKSQIKDGDGGINLKDKEKKDNGTGGGCFGKKKKSNKNKKNGK